MRPAGRPYGDAVRNHFCRAVKHDQGFSLSGGNPGKKQSIRENYRFTE